MGIFDTPVEALAKGFDPSEKRNKDGEWTAIGRTAEKIASLAKGQSHNENGHTVTKDATDGRNTTFTHKAPNGNTSKRTGKDTVVARALADKVHRPTTSERGKYVNADVGKIKRDIDMTNSRIKALPLGHKTRPTLIEHVKELHKRMAEAQTGRVQKATLTTGDLGGAGEAPTSVEQGKTACPECGRKNGKHKKGCCVVGKKEVGLTKEGTPADKTPEPFSASKTSNWVAKAGGLPNYVQHVAHALMKKGRTESEAIRMAIGVVKNWAEGKGDVSDAVRAAAGKAVAQWEKMKAKTHLSKALSDEVDSVSLEDPDIVWAMERAGQEICKEDIVNKAFDPSQPRDPHSGEWILAPGKSRTASFDKAHGLFSSTLADLKVGEAVLIEAPDAAVRNSSVNATHLGEGRFDVEDERVGDEGSEYDAQDTASSMIHEVEDNAPGVKKMVVTRYVEPDIDPKTGEWLVI